MNEKLIISNILNGKKNASKDLYDLLSPIVMGICKRYIGKNDSCNDVFQESFIKIFNSIGNFKGDSQLKTWASSITINTSINFLKKENKMKFLIDYNNDNIPETTEIDIENKIEIEPELALDWINELPENYRIVMNLFIDNKSHEEISTILNISSSSSRVTLNRARGVLKNRLENYKRRHEQVK